MAGMPDVLSINDEIARTIAEDGPVVALESTIVTHGMPWPYNLETALAVEAEVRNAGAVPATIAVFDGRIHIGLDNAQLEWLAKADDVMKLSRADLAYALSERRVGSTTVAATMMAAALAGIEVFATGGIGGVHQGAETSFDISADLEELGRTNVITVCAGAKAILDLNKTMEVLETNGVPVIGYGVDELPAFWSRRSGIAAPLRLDTPEAIAGLWRVRKDISQNGGVLITNPVPEADEIAREEMEGLIARAIDVAASESISGKDVTPFLLGKIVEISNGRSLQTNIALIRNNARLAGKIAVALCGFEA